MIMMPFNKEFTYSTRLKGADDCEHNYVEQGFDLHDKCYLILWCWFKFKFLDVVREHFAVEQGHDTEMRFFPALLLELFAFL